MKIFACTSLFLILFISTHGQRRIVDPADKKYAIKNSWQIRPNQVVLGSSSLFINKYTFRQDNLAKNYFSSSDESSQQIENGGYFTNKRNLYSSIWAFASLNYLYADLVGFMDSKVLSQYQQGTVDGVEITEGFLSVAAIFMQIPMSNVFLPHLIKNEKTLRYIQIISGGIMTIAQTATLFVGKPTPYYALFSAFEIAATTYITIDALKWKTNKHITKVSDYDH